MNGAAASLPGQSDGNGLELVLAGWGCRDRGDQPTCHADAA